MSKRLRELIQTYVEIQPDNGRARLAVASRVSLTTINHFMAPKSKLPGETDIYRLAKACGCEEADAQALAGECAAFRAKESA